MAESVMKTLKVEAVHPMAYATFEDVAEDLPRFSEDIYNRKRLPSALGHLSPVRFEDQRTRRTVKPAAGRLSGPRGPRQHSRSS
jgi:putative transposase